MTMVSGFALPGYTPVTVTPSASTAMWSVGALVAHDFVLFPLYALADRAIAGRRKSTARREVPVRNYIRVPALATGLTLLIFLPGIIRQGAPVYQAATGQTQQPFLGRWLLLTAVMFGIGAVVCAARRAVSGRSSEGKNTQQAM